MTEKAKEVLHQLFEDAQGYFIKTFGDQPTSYTNEFNDMALCMFAAEFAEEITKDDKKLLRKILADMRVVGKVSDDNFTELIKRFENE